MGQLGLPQWLSSKESACNAGGAGDVCSIPVRKIPGGRRGYLLQYPCLENLMDRQAWQSTVPRVAKSWTQLKQLSMHTRLRQLDGLIWIDI